MRNIAVSILLVFAPHAHAKEPVLFVNRDARDSMDKLADKLLDQLVARVLRSRPIGSLASVPHASFNVPRMTFPVHHSPFHLSHSLPIAAVAAERAEAEADGAQAAEANAQGISRRHAGLTAILGGLAAAATLPTPALAEDAGFSNGPDGLKYLDVTVGDGNSITNGDVLKVNYQTKLATSGEKLGEGNGFLFCAGKGRQIPGWEKAVLGAGEMPPMKVGGTRRMLIPPDQGYGENGVGCKGEAKDGKFDKEAGGCAIPGNSELDFTIEVLSVRGRCAGLFPTPAPSSL